MFNPTQIVIQAFVEQLKDKYRQIYGDLESAYRDIIGFVGRLSLSAEQFLGREGRGVLATGRHDVEAPRFGTRQAGR